MRYTADAKREVIAGPLGYSDTDSVYRIDVSRLTGALFAQNVGRMPDGLALDQRGDLLVSCYVCDNIHRISPAGERSLFANDRWAILLSRPANIAFHGGYLYAANPGRTTISRAPVGRAGKLLANQQ